MSLQGQRNPAVLCLLVASPLSECTWIRGKSPPGLLYRLHTPALLSLSRTPPAVSSSLRETPGVPAAPSCRTLVQHPAPGAAQLRALRPRSGEPMADAIAPVDQQQKPTSPRASLDRGEPLLASSVGSHRGIPSTMRDGSAGRRMPSDRRVPVQDEFDLRCHLHIHGTCVTQVRPFVTHQKFQPTNLSIVEPEPGDVRQRRGCKLAGGRGLTARNTRYHLDTIVWCCLNWQRFLLFFTEYKTKITRQSARPFAARRVISARPSPRPRRRSQLRAQVRGELFSATTSTRTATTEYGARVHA